MKNYFKIQGINHGRYVGIDKTDGTARDFYILNNSSYRPAETAEEKAACRIAGLAYYSDCRKKLDEFGLREVSENELEQAANYCGECWA